MNTMLRSPGTPQQTALTPTSAPPAGAAVGSGVHRGVWIGGGLMALTIVALATALLMKGGGNDTTAPVAAIPAATATTTPGAAGTTAVAQAPATTGTTTPATGTTAAPVHHTVHHSTGSTATSTGAGVGGTTGGSYGANGAAPATESSHVAAAPVCTNCGVIDSYDAVKVQGQTNGVGAVAGGVGGAVLGSQIAGRNNKTLGGVIGAIGGGLLGNAIEQHERTVTVYDVHVRMNDGSMRTVRQSTAPQVGTHVTVDGNTLHAAPQSTSQGSTSYAPATAQGTTNYAPATNGGSSFSPTGS